MRNQPGKSGTFQKPYLEQKEATEGVHMGNDPTFALPCLHPCYNLFSRGSNIHAPLLAGLFSAKNIPVHLPWAARLCPRVCVSILEAHGDSPTSYTGFCPLHKVTLPSPCSSHEATSPCLSVKQI